MIIFYTGIGSNNNGQHTQTEFLNIMNREFTHKNWKYELSLSSRQPFHLFIFKDWVLPDDFCFFSFNDWILYSGAQILF
jgi:hypothetical protein